MKKVLLAAAVIMVFSAANILAGGTGTTALEFLKFDIGARPLGMGGAYAAVSNDINALSFNPGGLTQIRKKEASFTHIESFQSIRFESLGYVQPINKTNVIGGSLMLLSSGDMAAYNDFDELQAEEVSASDLAMTASYCNSALYENLSIGGTVKVISERLDNEGALGVALDAGALYKVDDMLTTAVVLQNIGFGVRFVDTRNAMPMNMKLGIAARLLDKKQLTLASDMNLALADGISLCFGGEYIINDMFAVRLGLRTKTMYDLGFFSGISFGLGFSKGFTSGRSDIQTGIDYAFAPYGELGAAHRISLYMKL